jgi:CRP/FNR family transcriptional regulator
MAMIGATPSRRPTAPAPTEGDVKAKDTERVVGPQPAETQGEFEVRTGIEASRIALDRVLESMRRGPAPSEGGTPSAADVPWQPVPIRALRRGEVLFDEGSPAEHLFVVRSGCFKCVVTESDGSERMLDIAGEGELLGYDALYRGRYRTRAVALEVSTVFAVAVRNLARMRERVPVFDLALQDAVSRQLDFATERSRLMSCGSAVGRVAAFLLRTSEHDAEHGESPSLLHLRLGRRDIAGLLGLSPETASRAIGTLAEEGLVRVKNRDIEILDLVQLRARVRSTRVRAADGDAGAPRRVAPQAQDTGTTT